MARSFLRALPAALLILAAACAGDDDKTKAPVASDYEGFWLFTSITMDEGGVPLTVPRIGDPGVRGDFTFTATADDAGVLDGRLTILFHGLPSGPIQELNGTKVTIDGDRWQVNDGDETSLFKAKIIDDRLWLDRLGKPGFATGPIQIAATRMFPWTTATRGNWSVREITFPDWIMRTGVCAPQDDHWAVMEFAVTIDASWLLEQRMSATSYDDPACTVPAGKFSQTLNGFVEEEYPVFRTWAWNVEDPAATMGYTAFTISQRRGSDVLVLTRTLCLPAGCEATEPLEVIVEPKIFRPDDM